MEQTSQAGLRSGRNSPLLLDLRHALQQAERCRLALKFVLRPQILDAIITRLQSIEEPGQQWKSWFAP